MAANCSFDAVDNLMQSLELVIYIPVFVAGLVLNVAALLVFCVFLSKWNESTIYMTSLALMDLLLIFPLPFKMHATNHIWPAHFRLFCSFLEMLYFVGMYGSIYTIMCIALDRWVSICHPFKAKRFRSPRAALGACVAVWVMMTAAFSPVYAFREAGQGEFRCFHGFSGEVWTPAIIVCLQVFGFLWPALVLIYCSVKTVWALRESERQSPKRTCVKIIYSGLCAFLVPFTPSHLAILLQFLVHQGVITDCRVKIRVSLFIQMALCLANITCCLDALCYYFVAHEVRSAKYVLRRSMAGQRRHTFSSSEV